MCTHLVWSHFETRRVPWLEVWIDRAAEALRAIALRPHVLFLVVLALNALAQPYAGIVHDARLYSIQTLNRLSGGAFADDLFLRYGSQDQYSLFSTVSAPLVGMLGLQSSFFLLYLAFNSLLLWAYLRLIRALLGDLALAAFAGISVVLMGLPFGGQHIFHVLEPFFTPRLIAISLVMFALERIIHGRFTSALALIAVGLLFHPLMACGGVMVWVGCLTTRVLPPRYLLLATGLVLAAGPAVLAIPSVGIRLFGTMDPDWYEMIRWASPFLFPGEWSWLDWLDTAVSSLAVMAAASLYGRQSQRARFLAVSAGMGVVGLSVMAVAARVPYALLFQGQPYRILWILKALQGPMLIALAARAWRANIPVARCGAVTCLGYLAMQNFHPVELGCVAFVFTIATVLTRGIRRQPRCEHWLVLSLATGLLLGLGAWATLKLSLFLLNRWQLLPFIDTTDYVRVLLDQLRPLGWIALVIPVVTWLYRRAISGTRLGWAALAVALAVQATVFITTVHPSLRVHTLRFGPEVQFVRQYLRDRPPTGNTPTIYAYWGRIDHVWIDLQAKSYFNWDQIVGVLFSRGTAVEGRRRALIVGPFELDRLEEMKLLLPDLMRPYFRRLFGADAGRGRPKREDLERLCRDGIADLAILRQEFPGLSAATNGQAYIYECRQVRSNSEIEEEQSLERPRSTKHFSYSSEYRRDTRLEVQAQ